ncbi:transposase [Lactococcus chungangensis]|uniref:transposase n=1 Tax=Pseudolactococcus chungangensis TaxID=451457 RepID=UPI003736BF47
MDIQFAEKIQLLFDTSLKGYRYIWMQLKRQYHLSINPKTILWYMRLLGLKSPIRKKHLISCTRQEINKKARKV